MPTNPTPATPPLNPALFVSLVTPNHACTENCHPENCPVEAKVLNDWEEDLRAAAVAHQEENSL